MSKIEWTDETWNPTVGCTPVSEGCRNCYAAREALRLAGNPHPKIGPLYEGTSEMRGKGGGQRPVFTGVVKTVSDRLLEPLSWRKPRRVFVDSMSDLFHEEVPDHYIARVFGVMALCPDHTFQILTKRPERMRDSLSAVPFGREVAMCAAETRRAWNDRSRRVRDHIPAWEGELPWPLPNVWLGTSVEDQAAADERVPHLVECPAAVRFLSCEPLLGWVDLDPDWLQPRNPDLVPLDGRYRLEEEGIHWIIAGGESGPRSRACDVLWIRHLVATGAAWGVPVFVKQLGAKPYRSPERDGATGFFLEIEDAKGGDMAEWPEDLRVRAFPPSQEAR